MPTVSIVIPAYNQDRYLAAAIRSALGQTHRDLEVIVVDDGSTDETPAVVREFTDRRLRYVRQRNQGLSAARNTGIRHSSGEFLTFLDSDDGFLPRKVEDLLAAFEQDATLGLVAGQAVLIDQDGREIGEVFDRPLPDDTSALLLGNPLHVGSVLLRRRWQERVGFFDESLRSYEDWDMWLRLARAGCPMGWVPRPVSLYRFHRDQMTRMGPQMTTATFAVLEKTFAEADALPEGWRLRRDEAYSRAFLRAAAQAYTGQDVDGGRDCLAEAVRLNPSLTSDDCGHLAGLVAGWANHAKTQDGLELLASIYGNLPPELGRLKGRRRRELARQARLMAGRAFAAGDAGRARALVGRAIRYWPPLALDRGLLMMALRGRARNAVGCPAVRMSSSAQSFERGSASSGRPS